VDIYERLGVQKVISCRGVVTVLGGSIMDSRVLDVMKEASRAHVVMEELLVKAGRRVAELIGVEAAFITTGASGGLFLASAALIAGSDPAKMARLPDTTGMKNEVIICKCQRYVFDQSFQAAGGRFVEIGDGIRTHPWQMEAAIGEKTAFSVWVPNTNEHAALPFETFRDIAKAHDVPILVDSAAELPPVSNLRKWTDMGADVVIFSGGKGIRGPQSTGLILGRQDLIDACRANSSPNLFIGRPLKVGKEEICGLVAALELYADEISKREGEIWERMAEHIIGRLQAIPNVKVWRHFPHNPTHLVPVVVIELEDACPVTVDEVLTRLEEGVPPIYAMAPKMGFGYPSGRGFTIKLHGMLEGEEQIVAQRLCEILSHQA